MPETVASFVIILSGGPGNICGIYKAMTTSHRHSGMSRFPPVREYLTAAWLVAILGGILSLGAFWTIHHQIKANKLLEFKWVAENRHRAISKEIDDELEALESIHNLFLVSEEISEKDFMATAGALLDRHEAVEMLAWIPRVSVVESQQTTDKAGKATHPDSKINRAPDREHTGRFPVLFVAPVQGNESLLGSDYFFSKVHRELLHRAGDGGEMVVSGRIELGPANEEIFGFVAFKPVYKRGVPATIEERRKDLLGYVAGVFRIDMLAKTATAVLEPRGVEFLISDESAPDDERFLDFYSSRLSLASLSSPANWHVWMREAEPQLTDIIELGDRNWSVTYAPTAQFRSAEGFQQGAWVVLIGGFLLTGLLTVYLLHLKQDAQVRTRMATALQEREELFRQMTESIDEVFWIQTPDSSEVLYVSPAYEKIWGRSRDSLYKEPFSFLDGIHPDDRLGVRKTLKALPEEEAEQVFRVVRPDGMIRWVRSRAFTVYNEQGEAYRVAGIREDITEIKQAEQALRKSEKELRTLINQSPDIIKTVDEKGRILSINRHPKGPPVEQAIGRNSAELFPSEYRKRYKKMLKKIFHKGTSGHLEYATADSVWWDVRLVPIRRDGEVIESMVIETDITEKKNLQEQATRNARLATLGVLAASVAHEINNPNNAIQFNASVLTRISEEMLPIVRQYWDQNGDFVLGGMPVDKALENMPRLLMGIKNSSMRIQKIVANLKHLSRHDKGVLSEDVDLLEVLQVSVSILKNQIHKYTDNFSMKLVDTLPSVQGNNQQLEQVFINVILNALQSLPDRTRGVFVSAFLDDAERTISVVVRDEGQGIPEDRIASVTEPFFTTKEKSGGTGLGLSISNEIIRNHKGKIVFSSEFGVGTSVTIKIPVRSTLDKAI